MVVVGVKKSGGKTQARSGNCKCIGYKMTEAEESSQLWRMTVLGIFPQLVSKSICLSVRLSVPDQFLELSRIGEGEYKDTVTANQMRRGPCGVLQARPHTTVCPVPSLTGASNRLKGRQYLEC
jgi:hypothetical protein